jgi:23S rRNA (adenine2503-C2)-methyltransferase
MPSQWSDIKVIQSSDANVAKYVFTKDGAIAESVLYKYPTYRERTVICCSTQAGCPVGCRFCGAGDSFIRSLTVDEIVSQPVRLLADVAATECDAGEIGRLQIMFMSMGEPLLNHEALIPALYKLHGLFPQAALLISTAAPRVDYTLIENVSAQIPTIGLQFSVHESTDEKRDALIPFKAKLSLAEIAGVGESWAIATGRRPFFNYCAHAENVSDEDADRLVRLFDPRLWQATISVVCERDESVKAAHQRQRDLALAFQAKLAAKGYSTRCFDPAGQDDIGGGCGQLWFVQSWMREHGAAVRPSIGRGLPVMHAPAA